MGSKLIKFFVKAFPKTKVIGKSVIQKLDAGIDDATITDLWKRMEKDGSLDFLLSLPNRTKQNYDTVGWMGDWQPGDYQYTYLAGILVEPNTPAPEGYVYRDIVDCEMAIRWFQGTEGSEGGDLFANASDNMSKAMKENGYQYDSSKGLFEMEYYSYERFRVPEKRGEKVILDFYSPCKKRQLDTP